MNRKTGFAAWNNELAAVMEAARPIDPRERDQYLRDVTSEMEKHLEIGPGHRRPRPLFASESRAENLLQRQKPL
jgi:hypothetical protein